MSTEREALRLHDIVENIERIESYLAGYDFAAFERDGKTIDAVERCLQRITEAAIKIGAERMAEISPRTPADAVRGLGNRLRHEYDMLDLPTLWRTARESLPDLREDCLKALG
ncbi:MAG: hypothetical protein B7Z08_05930 [Sphingomonadales bacterium 32-68-7]|nr:MAG: hypothetical protein B7Z33_11180 [Sphingomonadales bacterium 12-68-11]OYX09279.1 MAG: hypothetical protein B7Z08_05930 [Sphingomonadales bacterium 32-68-7]